MARSHLKIRLHVRLSTSLWAARYRLEMTSWINVMLSLSKHDHAVILRLAQDDNTILAIKKAFGISNSSKHDLVVTLPPPIAIGAG